MRKVLWVLLLLYGIVCIVPAAGADDCSGYRQWVEGESYTAGERVVYQDGLYEAWVSHTAYIGAGWTPEVASLWKDLGISCDGDNPPDPDPDPDPDPTPPPDNSTGTSFIPYFYSWSQDNSLYWVNDVSDMPEGVDHVLLAFALGFWDEIQLQAGDPEKLKQQIAAAQAKGVSVGVSTGGNTAGYLCDMSGTAEAVASKFVDFINEFGFQFIDVDFEGSYVENPTAVDRMVAIMTEVHTQLPNHPITLTVPSYGGEYGLSNSVIQMAKKLYDVGALTAVTAMSFDYYSLNRDVYQAARMSIGLLARQVTGECNSSTDSECAQRFDEFPEARSLYGIISMIGQADDGYVTTLEEQRNQAAFAKTYGLHSIGFWAINRDQGQGCSSGIAVCTGTDSAPGAYTAAALEGLGVTNDGESDDSDSGDNGSSGVVTVYQHIDYDGYAIDLAEGNYTLAQLNLLGVSDNDLSSVMVADGYKVTFYDGDNFAGDALVKTADDASLVDDGWNDRATSIKISAADGDDGGEADNDTDADCSGPWYQANLTYFISYPDPGSEECIEYNGCTWAGQFYGLDGKQSEEWVASHNIASVHSKDWNWLGMKTVKLRQGDREITATVYDLCSDSDCNGCCTQNLGPVNSDGNRYLIDIELYTMERFGSGEGTVEFQVCN